MTLLGKDLTKPLSPRIYLPILIIVIFISFPLYIPSFYVHVLIMTFLSAAGALAWNIIGGFGGQFSLGNAVFSGIGAYATAILLFTYGITPWVGMFVGVFLSCLLSLLIGWPTFKLAGHYFALATIAVVEIFLVLAKYFRGITMGSIGIPLVNRPGIGDMMFNTKTPYYYLTFALMLLALLITYLIKKSRFGYYLRAIREDQEAAAALGINPTTYKQMAFLISASITALVGACYTVYIQYIMPKTVFNLMEGIFWALLSLVGGIGTVTGPIIGSFLIEPFQIFMKSFIGGEWGAISNVIYGFVFILLIIFAPEGIIVWFGKGYRIFYDRFFAR